MTLGEFVDQRSALCVKAEGGDIWLAPDRSIAQQLVERGNPRERVWTVMEMREMSEPRRTVAGLLAGCGIAFGEVIAEDL